MPRGRPTGYRAELADIARKAFANGSTAEEVARTLEIDSATFYRWRSKYEDFAEACVTGKRLADEHVVISFHQRACGYEYTAERIFMTAHTPEPITGRYKRHVLADWRAALHWLRVRRPEEWGVGADPRKRAMHDIIEEAFARVAAQEEAEGKHGRG